MIIKLCKHSKDSDSNTALLSLNEIYVHSSLESTYLCFQMYLTNVRAAVLKNLQSFLSPLDQDLFSLFVVSCLMAKIVDHLVYPKRTKNVLSVSIENVSFDPKKVNGIFLSQFLATKISQLSITSQSLARKLRYKFSLCKVATLLMVVLSSLFYPQFRYFFPGLRNG